MQKVALFVFNGSPMCFVHVLLNALDMHTRGDRVQIDQLFQVAGVADNVCAQSI